MVGAWVQILAMCVFSDLKKGFPSTQWLSYPTTGLPLLLKFGPQIQRSTFFLLCHRCVFEGKLAQT